VVVVIRRRKAAIARERVGADGERAPGVGRGGEVRLVPAERLDPNASITPKRW